jgi:threonine efflux protein
VNPSTELLAFAGVMALGQFSPGPDMILLTRTALGAGARQGVLTALGIGCGLSVHATVAVAGAAVALNRLPGLRWMAAAYLLWLAWGILSERFAAVYSGGKVGPAAGAGRTGSPFLRGFFCNLLNPKAALFLAAASAPFLAGERPPVWPMLLWAVVVFQGGLLWTLWAWLLQWRPLRSRYDRAAGWIDGFFGIALVVLALSLMWG